MFVELCVYSSIAIVEVRGRVQKQARENEGPAAEYVPFRERSLLSKKPPPPKSQPVQPDDHWLRAHCEPIAANTSRFSLTRVLGVEEVDQ